jgi:hypothetical protein
MPRCAVSGPGARGQADGREGDGVAQALGTPVAMIFGRLFLKGITTMATKANAPKPRDEGSLLDELPTPELVSRALNEAKVLAAAELELAKNDVKSEAKGAMRAAIAFGVAAVAVAVALSLLSLDLVLAAGAAPWVAVALASGFAVLAGASGAVGYASLPKELLEPTRRRLAADVDQLRNHAI